MLSYITAFNKQVIKYTEMYPDKEITKLLIRYKKQYRYPDFYSAFDNLSCILGVEYGVETILKNEKCFYNPYLKLYYKNTDVNNVEYVYFCDEKSFYRSIDESYSLIAKEFLYKLDHEVKINEIYNILNKSTDFH